VIEALADHTHARLRFGTEAGLWRSFGDDNYAAPMTLA
jgi:hypothetical protein